MSDELMTLWCIASKWACTSFEITKCSMNWHSLFLAFGCRSIVKILVELNSICGRFMMLWATKWRMWRELSALTKTEVFVHDLLQFKSFAWPIPNYWQGFIVINCAIHQYYQVELGMWKHVSSLECELQGIWIFTVDHVVPKNDTGSIAKGFWPQTITKDYEEPD